MIIHDLAKKVRLEGDAVQGSSKIILAWMLVFDPPTFIQGHNSWKELDCDLDDWFWYSDKHRTILRISDDHAKLWVSTNQKVHESLLRNIREKLAGLTS